MGNSHCDSACKNGATPQAESAKRSPQSPARSNLEDVISELEHELISIAGRLEIHGLEPAELARLQESYTDITFAIQAFIKEWEGDHNEPGDSW